MNPLIIEKIITYIRYKANLLNPRTIFNAPRFVIFVEGPVIIKAVALPILIPPNNQYLKSGIVPPPQA